MGTDRHVAEDIKTASNILLGNEQAIRLYDGAGAYVGLRAPADLDSSGNYTYMLPTSYGIADYLLSTDGSGVLSWVSSPITFGTTPPDVNTPGRIYGAEIDNQMNLYMKSAGGVWYQVATGGPAE